MQNKEFRMYIVVLLIFMMFFMASVDKINKINEKNEIMINKIKEMNIELEKSKQTSEDFYQRLQVFKESQDIYLEIQDWQISDVNEKITMIENRISTIKEDRIILSTEELELFYDLVMAESGGESIECQRAVASVVINRVLHERFPKTFNEVVYQRNAFSVTFDGSIGKYEPTDSVKQAVNDALAQDYADGSISFLNVDLAIKQGYKTNVDNMLKQYDISMKIDNVTFLKEK